MTALRVVDSCDEVFADLMSIPEEWGLPLPVEVVFGEGTALFVRVGSVDEVADWASALGLPDSASNADRTAAVGDWQGWTVDVRAVSSS